MAVQVCSVNLCIFNSRVLCKTTTQNDFALHRPEDADVFSFGIERCHYIFSLSDVLEHPGQIQKIVQIVGNLYKKLILLGVVLDVAVVIVKLAICISAVGRSIQLFNLRFFILNGYLVLCSCFIPRTIESR